MKPYFSVVYYTDNTFVIFSTGFHSWELCEHENIWANTFWIELLNLKINIGFTRKNEI